MEPLFVGAPVVESHARLRDTSTVIFFLPRKCALVFFVIL